MRPDRLHRSELALAPSGDMGDIQDTAKRTCKRRTPRTRRGVPFSVIFVFDPVTFSCHGTIQPQPVLVPQSRQV
jgi:hypothetical protein